MKVFITSSGSKFSNSVFNFESGISLNDVIFEINKMQGFLGFANEVCASGKLTSNTRVFTNINAVEAEDGKFKLQKFYESEETTEISDLKFLLDKDIENILISIFDAKSILEIINNSITSQDVPFTYIDKDFRQKRDDYKPIISKIDFDCDVRRELIYGFREGETTLDELIIRRGEKLKLMHEGDIFDKKRSNLLPEDLVDAIREIWELPTNKGTLRLFQEDSLFFIMSRLIDKTAYKERQLLLSMPTGGGKTEAFMIPLLSRIYQQKIENQSKGAQSIIIYPTNALANDQAMRFVEMIYLINKNLSRAGVSRDSFLSIGILSGDTPNASASLEKESLIKICPRCGKSEFKAENSTLICKHVLDSQAVCNTRLDFCRLTKEDIVNNPPDILITNPDEINVALHSPKYLPIFVHKIESIVFDEVHIYQGVFGCHIAHLLRRFEEISENKPLYIGMSATIGNAVNLAALLFNEMPENIKYIFNENNKYLTDTISKKRYHAIIKPYLRKVGRSAAGVKKERYVSTVSAAGTIGMLLGHLFADSHFRKSIIFTNYRSEADDLAAYLKERERLDVKLYFAEIARKINQNKSLSKEEAEICQYIDKWLNEIFKHSSTINKDVNVGWNRGGLEKEERIRAIHSFCRNNMLAEDVDDDFAPIDLMVATKSLEVGIDIGDVTTVINSSSPFTTNEYVQRVGRAGRKKDSLAITILNPENAIDSHMRKHFKEYVDADPDSFEDAPIIINNEIITRSHIKARIVDFFNKEFINSPLNTKSANLTLADIIQRTQFVKNGKKISIGDGITESQALEFADYLFDRIFNKKIKGQRVVDNLIAFLNKESKILKTLPSDLSETAILNVLREIIKDINKHLQANSQNRWELSRNISGFDSVLPDLMPSLRGSGSTVGLFIGDSKNEIDTVKRQTAFNSMPLSAGSSIATTKSGISTFQIIDDKGESDSDAEKTMKREIVKSSQAINYFSRKLSDFPDSEDPIEIAADLNVMVPKRLRVAYFPSRFYCENCGKGLIPNDDYDERSNGVYCKKCGKKAQQLHKVIMCTDDECGLLYDPPVPKMCMNPNCPDFINAYKNYVANGRKWKAEFLSYFRFRLTKDLQWVCKTCNFIADHSSFQQMYARNSKHIVDEISQARNKDPNTTEGIIYKLKYWPEILNFSNPLKARYTCDRGHKNLRTVGVPRVRTIAYSFISNRKISGEDQSLCTPIKSSAFDITFNNGQVIQLSNEYMRRFSSGGNDEAYTLKTEKIFENKFWGNYYESHLAWFKFNTQIDDFICNSKFTCDGNCSTCNKFEPDKLDLGKMMKPQRELEPYNFDSVNMRPKRPDYRGRYCNKALDNSCNKALCQKIDGTDTCEDFDQNKYLRYLIVHTIKHGIIWALPKYAGVNVSEVKGEIYPNDRENGSDLVLIDSNEGGSGAILLIQKHWDDIWSFTKEIIKLTANNEANIILPHTCSRYNADLCPFIANEFLSYLGE